MNWTGKTTGPEKLLDIITWMHEKPKKCYRSAVRDRWISQVVQVQICKKQSDFTKEEYGRLLGRRIFQGLGNLGSHISNTVCVEITGITAAEISGISNSGTDVPKTGWGGGWRERLFIC